MLNGYQKQKMITNYSQENFKNIYWWLSKIKYNKFGCILMQHFHLWQNFTFVQSWILANNTINNGNFVGVANIKKISLIC
jgi:hypothetical protein